MRKRPTLEHWTTGITLVQPNEIIYRGIPIDEVIERWSFPATAWLLLMGTPPDESQEDAVRRALVAACDHGLAAPSIAAARICASTRGAAGVALATGLLAFAGPAHGGAAGECAKLLHEISEELGERIADDEAVQGLVRARLAAGGRIPGYGHPYHDADPRVPGLMSAPLASNRYRRAADAVERALVAVKGPRLHMNADAAVAAMLADAGLSFSAIDLVTSIGRCVGLAAHVHEEIENELPFRAPSLDAVEYVGLQGRRG